MWFMLNAPIKFLPLLDMFQLRHHLVLTHLLKESDEYFDFYRRASECGDFIVLDNSVNELGQPQVDLELAEKIKAKEVVAPDYLWDAQKTLSETIAFAKEVHGHFQVMGVPQGTNFGEYLDCLLSMASSPYVDVIGIGKKASLHLCDDCFVVQDAPQDRDTAMLFGRLRVLNFLAEEGIDKPVHLLGLVDPCELRIIKRLPFVRSFDTSYPFRVFVNAEQTDFFMDTPDLHTCYRILDWVISVQQFIGGGVNDRVI